MKRRRVVLINLRVGRTSFGLKALEANVKRLLTYLPDDLYARVAELARAEKTTSEKVILEAIQAHLSHRLVEAGAADAFGLWNEAQATRTYTESIRSEWEDGRL